MRSPDINPVRLIVGMDGSSSARAAVHAMAARSWPRDTECRVVTVLDAQLATMMPGLEPVPAAPDMQEARMPAEEAVRELEAAGIAAKSIFLEGNVISLLIREAEEFRADCIFVGARGLRGVERFLLGSVSLGVAMRAPCSVEIIHAGTGGAL